VSDEQGTRKPTPVKIEVTLDEAAARGQYINAARIFHNQTEVVMDFLFLSPQATRAPVLSRVIMSPIHAKNLQLALAQNLQAYEQKYGVINPHPPGEPDPGTILH
jgi:hypothetical protein